MTHFHTLGQTINPTVPTQDTKVRAHRGKLKDPTYMPLPAMHSGLQPLPDSFGLRTRSCHHQACCGVRARCAERRGTRWAAACAETGGCRGPSRRAPHLCTIPPWGLAGPLLYSWEWLVPPWTQWGQRGAPQCGEGSLLGADETLRKIKMQWISVCVYIYIYVRTDALVNFAAKEQQSNEKLAKSAKQHCLKHKHQSNYWTSESRCKIIQLLESCRSLVSGLYLAVV